MNATLIGIVSATITTLVGVMVWYLKHQTKRQAEREDKQDEERIKRQDKRDEEQKEERDYYKGLIKNDMQKNVDLNVKGIALQTEMMKEIREHDGHSREAWNKTNESLSAVCDKLNGIDSVKSDKDDERKK